MFYCIIAAIAGFLVIYMLEEAIEDFYPYLTLEDIETNGD